MTGRVLAILVLLAGLIGQALATPAQADALTEDEAVYIRLLVSDGIEPAPGYSWNDLILVGHTIAHDLRNGASPAEVAFTVWRYNPGLTQEAAVSVVAAAVVAFAPELVPIYTGEDPPLVDMVL